MADYYIKNETGTDPTSSSDNLSTNAQVGIGTSSPGAPLEVIGRSRIAGSSAGGGLWLSDADSPTNYESFIGRGNNGEDRVGIWSNNYWRFFVEDDGDIHVGGGGDIYLDNPTLVVDSGNNRVGVGTTSPGDRLQVYDGNLSLRKTDSYPQLQMMNYGHDNAALCFDSYYDGSNWKSSDAGSNYRIYKVGDELSIGFGTGVSAGANISSWGTALNVSVVNNEPRVCIGSDQSDAPLFVTQNDSSADVPVLKLDQYDSDAPYIHFVNGTVYHDMSSTNNYIKVKVGTSSYYLRLFS